MLMGYQCKGPIVTFAFENAQASYQWQKLITTSYQGQANDEHQLSIASYQWQMIITTSYHGVNASYQWHANSE